MTTRILRTLQWWLELWHRWPVIVGVLRGQTVIYQAQIGPPETALVNVWNGNGTVLIDSRFDGGSAAIHVEQETP